MNVESARLTFVGAELECPRCGSSFVVFPDDSIVPRADGTPTGVTLPPQLVDIHSPIPTPKPMMRGYDPHADTVPPVERQPDVAPPAVEQPPLLLIFVVTVVACLLSGAVAALLFT